MKSRWWIILVIVILLIVVLGSKRGNFGLTSPNFNKPSKQTDRLPNATPNAPKQYNFDSSTDLKMELESINPQILDSDFE